MRRPASMIAAGAIAVFALVACTPESGDGGAAGADTSRSAAAHAPSPVSAAGLDPTAWASTCLAFDPVSSNLSRDGITEETTRSLLRIDALARDSTEESIRRATRDMVDAALKLDRPALWQAMDDMVTACDDTELTEFDPWGMHRGGSPDFAEADIRCDGVTSARARDEKRAPKFDYAELTVIIWGVDGAIAVEQTRGTGLLEVAASVETHMQRWLRVYFLLDALDERGAVIKDLARQVYSKDCY